MRLAKSRLWPLFLVGGFLTPVLAASGLADLLATPAGPRLGEPVRAAMKTVTIRIKNRDVGEVAKLLDVLRSARGTIAASAATRTIRIIDRPIEVNRMARIVAEIDESDAPGQRIKTYGGMSEPAGTAYVFARVFVGPSKTEPGVTISKILPASREALLIVVANEAGLKQIGRLRPYGCPDADTPRTEVIRLKNRDVHQVARLLDKLKSAGGQVTTYAAWGVCASRTFPATSLA